VQRGKAEVAGRGAFQTNQHADASKVQPGTWSTEPWELHYGNGKSYDEFHGQPIHEPADARLKPSVDQLEWHSRERFLA